MNKIIELIKSNIRVIILIIVIVCFLTFSLNRDSLKQRTTYTVVDGKVEHLEETNLYLIKKEALIDYDKSLPVTAIIDQGKKASKYEAISTYKNSSYDEYLSQIQDIDKQIQNLVKDIPVSYSADIANIEEKILQYSKEVQKTTSYLKIQEFKTKLDELTYKKINIIANSTPDSSAIRDLVKKREELIRLSKDSSNTIFTPLAGIVTYKVDGLEGSYNYDEVEQYDISQLSKIIQDYDVSKTSEFGIKVIDNFNAYLLIKTARGDNDQYIKQYKNYKIRISDLENKTIYANLVNNIQDDEYNYSLFKINNEIDSLLDYRKLSCEVIWNSVTGMAVPLNAIYKDEEKGYDYVLMVYGTDYVKVPINIITKSDSIAITENVSDDKIKEIGLENNTFKLELYDELVIE